MSSPSPAPSPTSSSSAAAAADATAEPLVEPPVPQVVFRKAGAKHEVTYSDLYRTSGTSFVCLECERHNAIVLKVNAVGDAKESVVSGLPRR